ncbi:MAG: GDSL-type esterase/lipase family protein [Anaerolineae bacterium]|nr:GDSL-type esterase/lipase family protein [Anaerolineae bacterium]
MNNHCARRVNIDVTKRFILIIIILFLIILILELAWRAYLFQVGRGFFDDPREFTSPFFTTYEEPMPFITSTGFEFRNGSVSLQKPPEEIRIICFGGSTTVNWRGGISYPEILQQKFNKIESDYRVRVLNAGGDGYSTAHTLVNLSLRNLDAQPDIIVVYHNINDLSANWFGDGVTSDYGNKYKTDFFLDFRHRTGALAELAKVSRLARFVLSKFKGIRFPTQELSQNREYNRGLEYFLRNLRSIVAIARAQGIRVVFASQPAKSDFRFNQGFVAYNEAVRSLAEEEDVEFVDLASAVTDDDFFLKDSIHYTREGVARVAEEFYEPLAELVEQVKKEREGGLVHSVTRVQDVPLVTREIRYHMPEAGEVYLLWGINGWAVVPQEIRPAGTVVKDLVMHMFFTLGLTC